MSKSAHSPALDLVKESAIESGESDDMIFTADEWSGFEHHFKRRLAGAADSDEISGRSTELELRSYFVRQATLSGWDE